MRIDRYIAASRIVDLKSKDLHSAYAELLKVCKLPSKRGSSRKKILAELMEREKTITSYLGSGVALPHARVDMDRPYMLAVGRCPKGLQQEDADSGESVRFVFLLLAAKTARDYLRFLAGLAKTFQDADAMEPLHQATNLEDFRSAVRIAFGASSPKPSRRRASINRLFLSESKKVAKGSGCSCALVFMDVFTRGREPKINFPGMTLALAGEDLTGRSLEGVKAKAILNVRTVSGGRLSRVRGAILLGLTRGIIQFEDKVLCLTGVPGSDQLDTMLVLDVDEEFGAVLTREGKMLPSDVSPQALEYLLGIATELVGLGATLHRITRIVRDCCACGLSCSASLALRPHIEPCRPRPFGDERRDGMTPKFPMECILSIFFVLRFRCTASFEGFFRSWLWVIVVFSQLTSVVLPPFCLQRVR